MSCAESAAKYTQHNTLAVPAFFRAVSKRIHHAITSLKVSYQRCYRGVEACVTAGMPADTTCARFQLSFFMQASNVEPAVYQWLANALFLQKG